MKIGLTGTPGTGKTTIAEHLDIETVHLNEYMRENDIGEEDENGELEVDLEELRENQPEASEQDLLIEGHLAHHLDLDYCIVLRTRPDVLRERLEERNYSNEKVNDNVESEKLDLILSQAVQEQQKVFELDTTDFSIQEASRRIMEAVKNREERYGEVDWKSFI